MIKPLTTLHLINNLETLYKSKVFFNKSKMQLYSLICLLFFLFCGCTQNELDIDISDVNTVTLKPMRLEKDLFEINANNIDDKTKMLKQKYGQFYEYYLMNFIAPNGTLDSNYKNSILSFTSDKDVREAYLDLEKIYTDKTFESIENEINNSIKRFHYYFPEKTYPKKLITVCSGWNYAFAYMDSALVVALDMYLGDSSKFYAMLNYPAYQVRKMNQYHVVSDIIRGWMLTEFDKVEAGDNLLSHTIFYGKLFYAINALIPQAADSLIIGYTGNQLKYCKKYEKQLWGYFAEKNRLYVNDLNTVKKLTSDGPFTGEIHKDCPPRIAMWVGWQIVKNYMKNNKEVKMSDLMKDGNAQSILSKSRYRP